jgi:hypothetical protein
LVAGAREEKCWWVWRRNARDMRIYREGECRNGGKETAGKKREMAEKKREMAGKKREVDLCRVPFTITHGKAVFAVLLLFWHTAKPFLPCSFGSGTRQKHLCRVPCSFAHGEGFVLKCWQHTTSRGKIWREGRGVRGRRTFAVFFFI